MINKPEENSTKHLKSLPEGTEIYAYYPEDGEHGYGGELISYEPAGRVLLVAKNIEKKGLMFVDKLEPQYMHKPSDILSNFESGYTINKKQDVV